MTKVAIILPTTGVVQPRTVSSITEMVYVTRTNIPLTFHTPSMAGLGKVRNTGALMALADPTVTHLLWVDSDMTFPAHSLNTLLDHKLPIVGCGYRKRDGSSLVVAAQSGKVMTTMPQKGLHKVRGLGFGLILIERQVFDSMEMPYFYEPWVEGVGMVGEDIYFCLQAKELGYDTWMDATLSRKVGHLGTMEFVV